MEIKYHGQSCIQITSKGNSLIIDPFITHNPLAKTKVEDIQVQYVLLTHGHSDHTADAVEIAKRNNAKIIATFELATYMSWQGAETIPMNLGGSYTFEFGKVKLTNAFHSSSIIDEEKKQIIYTGMPAGLLITMEGKTLYHAGDTSLFTDMKWIGESNQIDVAFLPIGDHFTMGPEEAVLAAQWVRARKVVPVHYNTFPPIKQDAEQFVQKLQDKGIQGIAIKPGEAISI